LQHVIHDRWSQGSSLFHLLDARAKLAALLAFLIAVSTTPQNAQAAFGGYALLLVFALLASRAPLSAILWRAFLILPFSATFALVTLLSGNTRAALAFAEKSFLSGLAVVVMMATTPFLQLVAALEWARVPRFLVLVIQFLYRYLFVISTQANQMRMAARSRQGLKRAGGAQFAAAAGAIGVLFARSLERADGVYRAMVARGFQGTLPSQQPFRLRTRDIAICGLCTAACVAVRVWMVGLTA
jgi:cobalt/nickel transport system permease protein